MYQDITNKTYFPFDTEVWFGGAVDADGTSPMRPLVGKLTDMYVKIGVQSDYVITFDANHEMAGKELNFRIELVEVL